MANRKSQIANAFLVCFFVFLLALSYLPQVTWAAFEWEVPLPPAPGGATLNPDSIDSLFTYIYNFALGLGGLFAFFQLVRAGILWSSEGSGISAKADAKNTIINTIFGLLLLLFSWVILNTINPQILNLDISVSKTESGQQSLGLAQGKKQTLAGVFDSLSGFSQRQSLDDVIRHISQTYLIRVNPDIITPLSGPEFNETSKPICFQTSGISPACAMDCTQANNPCDYFEKKCAGEIEPAPGCNLPADPECKTGNGDKVEVCSLLGGDWEPDFPEYFSGCSNYASSPDSALPGSNVNGYKQYLKQAAAMFGVDPKILAAIMTSESEELVPKLLTGSDVAQATSPGGYIKVVKKGEVISEWCKPNWAGATGHMSLTIKACNITGEPKERCTWSGYCKFRNAANNIRNDWGYQPNPSNILDGFAIAAKLVKFFMDDGLGGNFDGMLNDVLGYNYSFSACPGKKELLKWDPPRIYNPVVFYVIAHFYSGNSIEGDEALVPRFLDENQLEIDVSGLPRWLSKNQEKILKVRDVFAQLLHNAGLGDFTPTTKITAPTYGDFIWWYYETH